MSCPSLLFQLGQAELVGDLFEDRQFATFNLATKPTSCYLIDFY